MPLIGPKEMFAAAYAGRYAVGAFNVNNMEIVQGIMQAEDMVGHKLGEFVATRTYRGHGKDEKKSGVR